eukprot:6770804-Prymnesium_polylepis.1
MSYFRRKHPLIRVYNCHREGDGERDREIRVREAARTAAAGGRRARPASSARVGVRADLP